MFKNKTLWIVLAVIAVIIFASIGWVKGIYNNMVTQDENVKTAWSQVENQYQRRMDLIPNLVNTVKGYATHEQQTLEGVINARANATRVNINVDDLDEESLRRFQAAQGELSSALSRLLAVAEQYPDLKANQNFLELQAQLEGTENRISVERKRYNETAQQYNTYIRSFPNNMLAGMFGFHQKAYFAAETGAERAPVVEF
ncbi:MAG: LemA family protein [Tannerellaceae bacterium]|nr:LemA family protein [Tannerellaceae bacterium]